MFTLRGYEDIRLVHEGVHSLEYSATRAEDSKPVRIKTHKSAQPRASEISLLYHEYELSKDLHSPHILQVYALIEEANQYALIKEDIHGITLKEYLRKNPITDLSSFLAVAKQLLAAVNELQQLGIIHKDIKPRNFVVDPEARSIKLTQFAFAANIPRETQDAAPPDKLEGSLAYMAPEQTGRMNMNIDYRADIYALGVTFYEMLVGRLPFVSSDPLELVHAHIALTAPDVSALVDWVPESLSQLIKRMMAKDPADRYQSIIGITLDLERIENGEHEPFPLATDDATDRLNISQKLYGREREAALVVDSYEKAAQGTVQALMVSGYSGIGKTMLINEVHKSMVHHRGYFISGKFDQLQRNRPFTAISQALTQLARYLLAEPEERFRAIKAELQESLGVLAQAIIDLAPEFQAVLESGPALRELPAAETLARLKIAFKRFLSVVATAKQPLVIFIDDLQWVDSGSLELIEAILSDVELSHLMLIGAYRSNEVDEHHPLSLLLYSLDPDKQRVRQLRLPPLTPENYEELLKDTLSTDEPRVTELATYLHKRTDGNPYFLKVILNTIYRQDLLRYDYERRRWDWDIDGISALALSANVVDLMISRIEELPSETRDILRAASCLGNRFDIRSLALVVEESAESIGQKLWPAIKSELLFTLHLGYKKMEALSVKSYLPLLSREIVFQFSHDRVQQAVYQTIPAAEKEAMHLRIANALLAQSRHADNRETLFQITDHFNQAHSLLMADERIMVASLNSKAAEGALTAAAYVPMRNYSEAGMILTRDASWETHYSLMFKLRRSYAYSLFLTGNTKELPRYCASLLDRARTALDRASVYRLQCLVLLTEGDYQKAFDTATVALSLLGVQLAKNPSRGRLWFKLLSIKRQLRNYNLDNIDASLKELRDPKIIAAFEILGEIIYSVYWIPGYAYEYCIMEALQLLLRYGAPVSAGLWLSMYAIVILNRYRDVDGAIAVCAAADRMLAKQQDKYTSAMAYDYSGLFIYHLREPFGEGRSRCRQATLDGLESGSLVAASGNMVSETLHTWWEANSCLEFRDITKRALDYTRKIHMKEQSDRLAFQLALAEAYLSPPADTDKLQALHDRVVQGNNLYFIAMSTGAYSTFLYFDEKYKEAYHYHLEWMKEEPRYRYCLPTLNYKTLNALAIARLIPRASWRERGVYWRSFNRLLRDLTWAANQCPANYGHQRLGLLAAKESLVGSHLRAIEYYEQAWTEAKKNNAFLWVAVYSELAGILCATHRLERWARHYIREAHYYYDRYGMRLKSEALEASFPSHFLKSELAPASDEVRAPGESSLVIPSESVLDSITLVKASQAISGEIVLVRLVERMLRIVANTSGAERAIFLEQAEEGWQVVAELSGESFLFEQAALKDYQALPLSVVRATERAASPVILGDGRVDDRFLTDPYIQRTGPKSVLCVPIKSRDRVNGVVYLENNQSVDVFTQRRVAVVNTLAAQIAVSLENAHLLEHTQQLYQATERFVPKAFLKLLNKEHVEDVQLGDSIEINLTVLFADIRKFTTLIEQKSPSEAYAFINAYLKAMAPVIRAHNGFISQYMGDGIMALFPGSAEDAVLAVRGMSEALVKFNQTELQRGGSEVSVGYGLNSGPAMLGTIGEQERMDANVISDTSNLASRVEGMNKYYGTEFLAGDATISQLKGREGVVTRLVDRVRVKGRRGIVYLHEVYMEASVEPQEQVFIDLYERAFRHYESGKLKAALELLRKVQAMRPDDGPTAVMIERCQELVDKPLPPDWDATFDMVFK